MTNKNNHLYIPISNKILFVDLFTDRSIRRIIGHWEPSVLMSKIGDMGISVNKTKKIRISVK